MAGTAFDLHSLLPQRSPLDAFRHAGTDPEAFSAAFIWFTVLSAGLVFVWVVFQYARVLGRCSRILKFLQKITPENASEHREILHQQGDVLWREWDSSLIEEHEPSSNRVWLRRTVDAAQVFNERTLAHGLVHSRLIAATPGLLTAVGVLGAFTGLQLGLKSLNLAEGQIGQSIPNLVASLSVKFSASIWGIGMSIAFNVAEKLVVWLAIGKIQQVQLRLDSIFPRYTAETALARLQTSSSESEKILRGLAAAIGGQMQQALAQVGQFTSQAIGEAMAPAVNTLTEAAQRLTSDLSSGSAEGLSQGIATASQQLQESLERVGDRYNQQFIDLSRRLTESFEGLQNPVARLSEALGHQDAALTRAIERLDAHADVADVIAGAAGALRGASDRLGELRESWELSAARNSAAASAQERASSSNERVAGTFEAITGRLDDFRENIDAAVRIVGSFGMPMQDLQSLLAGLPVTLREIEGVRKGSDAERDETMRQITGDLAETIRRAAEQLSGHAQVAEALRAATDRIVTATVQLDAFAQVIRDGAIKQEKAALAAENAAHSNSRAADALGALPAHLSAMQGNLAKAATSFQESASLAAQGYSQGADQQRRFLQGLSEGLGQFADRIRQVLQIYGDDVQAQTRARIQEFAKETADILVKLETLQNELGENVESVQAVASRLRNGSGRS